MSVPVLFFSDFTCPFCYVTHATLRRAEAAGEIELRALAYELHPAGTPEPPAPEPWPEALLALARVEALPPPAPPSHRPRTAKAHELAYLAQESGQGAPVREALFAAYWAEGRDIGRIDVLIGIAGRFGIDPATVKVTLDVARYLAHLQRDADAAARLGVAGVPAAVFGTGEGAVLLTGTHPAAVVAETIRAVGG